MASLPTEPRLGDLIDLEFHLGGESEQHVEAAKAVGQVHLADGTSGVVDLRHEIQSDRSLRWRLMQAWLMRLRSHHLPMPGLQVENSLRLGGGLLSAAGLILGAGAAATSLSYDGQAPVNLWQFLAVFVLLQVVLLVFTVIAVGTSWLRKRAWASTAQRLLQNYAGKHLPPNFSGRHSLYSNSQRWLLMQLTQRFGVFFNLGALLVFAWLVLFSDLAFAWSTTPANIDPSFLSGLVTFLAMPWAWLMPQWVPDAAAVESTRWSRLDGAFLAADQEIAAGYAASWWIFLFMALLCWGLLPRLIAWLVAGRKYRQSLHMAGLNHAAFFDLFDRMLPTSSGSWQHPEPGQVQGQLITAPPGTSSTQSPRSLGNTSPIPRHGDRLNLLIWGGWELPATAWTELFTGTDGVIGAGGALQTEDQQALQRVADQPKTQLTIIVESEESPDKRLLRFLAEAREKLQAQVMIHVALVDWRQQEFHPVDDRRLHLGRTFLGSLNDPYLRVSKLP